MSCITVANKSQDHDTHKFLAVDAASLSTRKKQRPIKKAKEEAIMNSIES
jgi:predicted peroxiredoxin